MYIKVINFAVAAGSCYKCCALKKNYIVLELLVNTYITPFMYMSQTG